jgi:hypothetical protein
MQTPRFSAILIVLHVHINEISIYYLDIYGPAMRRIGIGKIGKDVWDENANGGGRHRRPNNV